MNFKGILLIDKSQTQKDKYSMIPFTWDTCNRQILKKKVYQGLGAEGNDKLLFNGYRLSVWDNKKVLEMNAGDGSQHCECT